MRDGYSFQDALASQRAANERTADERDRLAARGRSDDYAAGQAAAADIIGRVASFGSSYERNTKTLRTAAARQHSGLAGRVAAGMLAEAAAVNEAQTPDTTAEARRIDALERAEAITARIAAARERNAERSQGIDRDR